MIPDYFKTGEFQISLLKRFDEKEIEQWASDKENNYWFQGFQWLPNKYRRSDSNNVWWHMNDQEYMLKTVLDYGCHTGYYAFQAASRGAITTGIDKDKKIIQKAKNINDHIEMQDVEFIALNELPKNKWYDYIFYMSVLHQHDPSYKTLKEVLENLKSKCKILFIELINPPLEGNLTKEQIDKIVGGKELLYYKHNIRKMRSLYRVKGSR
jgi:2-polyprenyl-3-methyl-5-hydroxy-6-metoxy-1,4-benzoquinol methylase